MNGISQFSIEVKRVSVKCECEFTDPSLQAHHLLHVLIRKTIASIA